MDVYHRRKTKSHGGGGEKIENTYRLDPPQKFRPSAVEPIVTEILEKHLKDKRYDSRFQPRLTKLMTEEIIQRIKDLNFRRYRYVVSLSIGEKRSQGLRVVSRCLWDADRDTYCSVSYNSNKFLFAVANVYAVYFE